MTRFQKIYTWVIVGVIAALTVFACWKMHQAASHEDEDNRAHQMIDDWEGKSRR